MCFSACRFVSKVWIVELKAELFGRRMDDDHKTSLVSPTYENPGYVDEDDDVS